MINHVSPTEAELVDLEHKWDQLREFSDAPMPERLIFQAKWREIAGDLMGSIANPLLPRLIAEAREAARLRKWLEIIVASGPNPNECCCRECRRQDTIDALAGKEAP